MNYIAVSRVKSNLLILLEKYEAEYVDRFANPFPAATRGKLPSFQSHISFLFSLEVGNLKLSFILEISNNISMIESWTGMVLFCRVKLEIYIAW